MQLVYVNSCLLIYVVLSNSIARTSEISDMLFEVDRFIWHVFKYLLMTYLYIHIPMASFLIFTFLRFFVSFYTYTEKSNTKMTRKKNVV